MYPAAMVWYLYEEPNLRKRKSKTKHGRKTEEGGVGVGYGKLCYKKQGREKTQEK